MTFCEKCGTQFSAAYCTKCGVAKQQPLPPMSATLAESKFCTSCGKAVAAAHCTGCGTALALTVNVGKSSAFAARPAAANTATTTTSTALPVPTEWLLMAITLLFALSTMNWFGGLMLIAVLIPAAVLIYDSTLYVKFRLFLNTGAAGFGLLFAILATFTGTIRIHIFALILCILGLLFIAFIGVRDMLKLKLPDVVENILAFIEGPMYFYLIAIYFTIATVFIRAVRVVDLRFAGFGREVFSVNLSGGRVFASIILIIILLGIPTAIAYSLWRGITGLVDKLIWTLGGVALFSVFIMPLFFRRNVGVPILYILLGYGAVILSVLLVFLVNLLPSAQPPTASSGGKTTPGQSAPTPSIPTPSEPGYVPANVDRVAIKLAAKDAFKQQWGVSIGAPLLVGLISIFINIFSIPFWVNTYGMFHKIYKRQTADIGDSFSGHNYGRKLGGILLVFLFTWLWALLLWIPGIIKFLSYSMTVYILAEFPNVTVSDAIKLSMRMTNGYKGKLFVTAFSFIGWLILGSFTFGILTIIFVAPYIYTTFAGFYEELKKKALETDTISAAELV